jgi:hypothetical protein
MKKHRFTSFWAALLIVGGLAVLVFAMVLAAFVLFGRVSFGLPLDTTVPGARVALAGGIAVFGLLLAGPSIVAGQLLQIFLDQRRLLRLIHGRLRAMDEREREREALERAAQQRKPRRPESV